MIFFVIKVIYHILNFLSVIIKSSQLLPIPGVASCIIAQSDII